MRVSGRCLHFKHARSVNAQQRHIKRPAAQVKHQDILLSALLIKSVCDRRRCGLVDHAHHVESSDNARILRGLTLGVVKVRRYSHHRILDLLSKILLRNTLHLSKNHG
mmetsp:Transcript_3408/g.7367  ORF Transcript_3408/g.7367 Transcript_3408/m.7367 type:complete len:108 (+) Transcript_3408:1648-1971(+)